MYCSECLFFRNDGICKNPKSRFKDVGYFQKAGKCFTSPAEMEQKEAEIEQITPKIEQTMAKENDMVQSALDAVKRVCADCGRELPIESFQRNTKGARISICKDCMAKRRKAGRARGGKSPEQKLMEAVEKRGENIAEYLKDITDLDLAKELHRRGYAGVLTRHEELHV